MRFHILLVACVLAFLGIGCSQQTSQAAPPAPGSPEDLVQRGQKLNSEGKQDEALALYKQVLEKSPDFYPANLESGIALDLKGDYSAAREHLKKAIDEAPANSKQQSLRTMAFSYAFEGNGAKAAEFETQVIDARTAKNDFIGAAEGSNELARLYLESGDPDKAYEWYKKGYETALRKTDLSETEKNLWLFRWENAQARVDARKGKRDQAEKHVTAAKAALDKANNPDQARFYPYLTGYVAFYTGDYKTAIEELQKADQRDPLILALLGESYEKSGDAVKAKEYYGKVMEINIHNPTNAFARPLARKKLQSGS